jgi:hypothetical protein
MSWNRQNGNARLHFSYGSLDTQENPIMINRKTLMTHELNVIFMSY